MNKSPPSIVLISEDTSGTSRLSEALRLNPAFDFEEHSSSLSGLNGKTTKLVSAHDLVLFQTQSANENDIEAIREIRKSNAKRPIIFALSDDNTTLAQVQSLKDTGVDDVFADSISVDDLENKIANWLRQSGGLAEQSQAGGRNPGHVISVAQSRGGVGATTLAVNLADELLERTGWRNKTAKHKVALVDLNLQFGAVGGFLDVRASEALFQLAADGSEPDPVFLSQSMVTLESGLSVLTAPAQIAPLDSLKMAQVKKILEILRSEYDYVVIDLPRALVDWVAPVLSGSDQILLVTDSSVPAIQQAKRLVDFYVEDNPDLPIEIVVNYEHKPMFKARHHAEAARVLERPLQNWLPYQPKVAKEALDRGVPLSHVSPRSALCKSIRKLARATLDTTIHHQTAQKPA